jgi:Polyketide cyclase / dehydrase and lipid transport
MKMEQSIIIARPVEAVFAYRASLQQTREWQAEVLATELATAEPIAVGTQGTERRRESNETQSDWDIEVTEFELNRVLSIVSRCGPIQICERDVFTADEGDTRYTAFVEITGSPLPPAAFHRKTVEGLMRFKWWIEGQA